MFYPIDHIYKDNFGRTYTSCTQVNDAFTEKKDWLEIAKRCELIGNNPGHPKYNKYKGCTAEGLLNKWARDTRRSLDIGNDRHDMLDMSIRNANNYNNVYGTTSDSTPVTKDTCIRLNTINELVNDKRIGEINVDVLLEQPLCRYEKIRDLIIGLHKQGYRFYSEIGVYHYEYIVSGLIDLVAIKGKEFIIIDWKTNRDIIMFEAGYFDKDDEGNVTDNFIHTWETFTYPIDYIPASVGHKYTLQLSGYTFMLEQFGFKNKFNVLAHIRRIDPNDDTKEIVEFRTMDYMKDEIKSMYTYYYKWKSDGLSKVA